MVSAAEKGAAEKQIYRPSDDIAKNAHIDADTYKNLYDKSVKDPEGFWADMAARLDWYKTPTKIKNVSYDKNDLYIKWYEDGVLNAAYNCIDRHLPERADQTAFIFEGDDPSVDQKVTFAQLKDEVSRVANALKERGVKKGDRVTIYMPMVLEAAYAMLACARIGAVHSVVFGGFSPNSLRDRILDCESDVLITADEGVRGGKAIPLKKNADAALEDCPDVHTVLVLKRTGGDIAWKDGRDVWWHEIVEKQSPDCPCEEMNAEDPLFILYTSGSTGKPKGVLHTTGGYMVYTSLTHEWVFDYKDGEVYWCTADVGWITGHSYIVYGPLANGATSLIFEGVPNYPDISRFWQVVDKHQVNSFYTAPTAIRALLKEGDDPVKTTSRKSLRLLGTVGEPINHEAWMWYHEVVGDERCPIIDTWWQTETGGHLITPLPGATPTKPGSATTPFFGIEPAIVTTEGEELDGACEGALVIKDSWPGQMRTVYKDHDRFIQTYFSTFPGSYFTGDGARRDEDGYYWITGRMDDVINVSGHRLGTAEIESAIDEHELVAESAVVGFPHDLKGQGIYAYVTLTHGATESDELKTEIVKLVREIIGPIAKIDVIQFADGLPKTRSGKIMRRILRKIAAHEESALGDTSTLADPSVVEKLLEGRPA
ncbi:MAG: acetate--CoA ligase [Alphaproteobacteria bacterium]|jgi:acetyl-CoA synthetase|nr:acetate--CoA ligase [Alphaproteobacteria bacterium]MDP7221777.1 acetate--CoA ligase [Alphaproteobacteria bacterium]